MCGLLVRNVLIDHLLSGRFGKQKDKKHLPTLFWGRGCTPLSVPLDSSRSYLPSFSTPLPSPRKDNSPAPERPVLTISSGDEGAAMASVSPATPLFSNSNNDDFP